MGESYENPRTGSKTMCSRIFNCYGLRLEIDFIKESSSGDRTLFL